MKPVMPSLGELGVCVLVSVCVLKGEVKNGGNDNLFFFFSKAGGGNIQNDGVDA